MPRASLVAGLLLGLLPEAACRRAGKAPPAASELVIAQIASAVTLDPHLHNEESTFSTLSHFYDSLVTFSPEMELRPSLAIRWENPSELVWRLELRRGVLFHDGRPFGAPDVVASLKRAQRLPGSGIAHYLRGIQEVKTAGDGAVEIITKEPTPVLLNRLVFVGIVPRDTPDSPIVRPVGTGPYRFESGAPGAAVRGRRFERYWGVKPDFPSFVVLPLPDPKARAEAVLTGRAQIVSRVAEAQLPLLEGRPDVRVVRRPGEGVNFLAFSLRKGSPFADRRVRQAVALTLDRARLAPAGPRATLRPIDEIVPPDIFGYSESLEPSPHDPVRARSLLVSAGYPHGLDASLLINDSGREIGEAVAAQLAELGIRVRVISLPWERFYERWSSPENQLTMFNWAASTGDASDILEALFHSPGNGYGSTNYFGYANPELDRLIEQADRTFETSERREAVGKAMRILREDLPAIPLTVRVNVYAARTDVDWVPRADRQVRAFDVRLRSSR